MIQDNASFTFEQNNKSTVMLLLMAEMIIDAVNHIDVSKYKESMSPLIKKDIDEVCYK